MENNWQLGMIAGLDGAKSRNQLNSDIKGLSKNLDKLKLYTEIDKNQVTQLQNQLKKLQIDLNTVTVTDAAINGLVAKINAGLQNIQISNINVGNVTNQAQQVGQQIGNNIGQQITQSISSAIQKGTMKSADGKKDLSEYIPNGKLLQNDVAKQALKDFQALGVGIVTVKEEMENIDGKNLLNGFTINIKNAKGEVESLKYALKDIEGKTGQSFQYIGGSINDNGVIKQMNAISAKADSLQNKLEKLKSSYSDMNASRPIKDSNNISALSQQYDKVTKSIENVRNADSTSFSSMVSNAQREITVLENMVSQFRNAENVATQMKSVDISSGIAQAQERLGKLKANASGFDQMKQTIVDLDAAIAKVGDKSSLDAFINKLKVAESQLGRVKAESKVNNKAVKEQESLANAIAKGREQSELARQAEEKRQQIAQNNAINKALEQEYQERQKNIQAAQKQAELDKQNALAFTKSASERLSSAISKYSYGDTSDANAMMKQMNRGLSNFGDLSNVQGNITQLSSAIDKIIADLKLSHEQSLRALNEEIKAEQTLQSQKDAFNRKNINAIDYEIQKREEQAKAFSAMLQEQMLQEQKLADQANKIQLSFDTGSYQSKVDSLVARTNQWVDANGNARISTESLQTALNNLSTAYTNLNSSGGNTVANQQALIEAEKALDTEVKKVQSSITSMNATTAKSSAVDALRQKVQMFYDTNSKAHWKWGKDLKSIMTQLASGTEVPITKMRQLEQEFIRIQNSARQAGKLGLSFFDTIKQGISKFSYWTSSTFLVMKTFTSIKSAVSSVKELDTALVDLRKTAKMSASELENFYYKSNDVAKQMGVTTKEIITQAAAWSRLGFNTAESATEMAKLSAQFKMISPGMTLDEATDGLVSVMKAYGIEVNDVLDGIMSKINIIGNNKALNNSDIVDFLTRSSAAMAEANNSLEETIALGEAA